VHLERKKLLHSLFIEADNIVIKRNRKRELISISNSSIFKIIGENWLGVNGVKN
jgi:hypothetical protein